jgi:hypothetical protein
MYAGMTDTEIAYALKQEARREMERHREEARKAESRLVELKLYYGMSDDHFDEIQMAVRTRDNERRLAMVEQMEVMGGMKQK